MQLSAPAAEHQVICECVCVCRARGVGGKVACAKQQGRNQGDGGVTCNIMYQ